MSDLIPNIFQWYWMVFCLLVSCRVCLPPYRDHSAVVPGASCWRLALHQERGISFCQFLPSSPSLLQTLSALARAAKELRALPASLTTAAGSCFLPGGMSEQVSLASYWCLTPSSSFEWIPKLWILLSSHWENRKVQPSSVSPWAFLWCCLAMAKQ